METKINQNLYSTDADGRGKKQKSLAKRQVMITNDWSRHLHGKTKKMEFLDEALNEVNFGEIQRVTY